MKKTPSARRFDKRFVVRAVLCLGLFILTTFAVRAFAQGQKFAVARDAVVNQNSQTMSLLSGHLNVNPTVSAGNQLAIIDDSALLPSAPDAATFVDQGVGGNGQISTYIVRQGDTLSAIAKMFGVSTNTITWANNLKGGLIQPGQELVILPITGVEHTVAKGDTLQSIAKKYGADLGDILSYNGLSAGASLTPGQVVIVPDGELGSAPASSGSSSSSGSSTTSSCGIKVSTYERLLVNPCKYPSYPGYFARPIAGGTKSQNLHGYNAVDLAAPYGTLITAAADGTVIVSKVGGYNGGYGTYVVVSHPNGTQTLYAHMSKNVVTVGEHVTQGEAVGAIGLTGETTGPHVHFEVRGARNPF